MEWFLKYRIFIIIFALIVGAFLFFSTTSSEIILHNSEPLDLSAATVEQIQSNTLVDAKITDTVGIFAYTTKSQEYYYLIPMDNGKYIIFVTGNLEQKDKLNTYINSYYGTLDLDIKGRISHMTPKEQNVFFQSVVDANIGVNSIEEAMQYIVPYKIENDNSFTPWINLFLALLCMGGAIFFILLLIKKRLTEKAVISQQQGNLYTGNEYQETGYNPYEQNSQTDNIKNDINRF